MRESDKIRAAATGASAMKQEPPFKELDWLLSVTEDKKQLRFAQKLAEELAAAVHDMRRNMREVEDMVAEDAVTFLKAEDVDSKKLFAELVTITEVRTGGTVEANTRLNDFEKDVRGLLHRVASDSEALSAKFPIEPRGTGEEDGGDEAATILAAAEDKEKLPFRLQELLQEDGGSPPSKLAPRIFGELGPLVDQHGTHVKYVDQTSKLSTSLSTFLSGAQKNHTETVELVDRVMRGEGPDGHPRDQEHAAWRRTTLLALKRPAPSQKSGAQQQQALGATLGRPASRGAQQRINRAGSLPAIGHSRASGVVAGTAAASAVAGGGGGVGMYLGSPNMHPFWQLEPLHQQHQEQLEEDAATEGCVGELVD
eukprot:CAMPEP_0206461324 /NCGR_PEP_ID=MMETSP0324_2-20121206/25293_1 /ASSEMBLY_ACC=CAM_ASM_000836 /TAXON_ID=2866 /ORGANISM="Crypthecodinium cohnii, Strain Seligo" /LENGTH=367 /DNA_ID=CAMNT_0053933223 /DNA_START=87 /DNA_END=1191 /DNA_ORIENTATION=-